MTEELPQDVVNLLAGRISRDDIQPIRSRVIKVYLCSAGSDSVTERDAFLEVVYPRLRSYCRDKYGLEFQIVDLNWGTPPLETHDRRDIAQLRRRQIRNCQEQSTGLNFIAFLGQKYGPASLPETLSPQHYEAVLSALRASKGKQSRNSKLLEQCYIRDENNIPPLMVLQDRTVLVQELSSKNEEIRVSAENKWKQLQADLRQLLQKGAELACANGTMDDETRERMFASELEHEILLGMQTDNQPNKRCLLITRNIVDLKNYTQDPRAATFAEVRCDPRKQTSELDTNSASRLIRLKNKVLGHVPESSTIHQDVLWRYEKVIDPVLHHDYLEYVCNQLYSICVRLIDEEAPPLDTALPTELEEVVQHWNLCGQLTSDFFCLSPTLETLREYVAGTSTSPRVLYGPSGCGKSKIVSKLAFDIQEIISEPYVLVIRYVGLTTKSGDIRQLLTSLCTQVAMATGGQTDQIPYDIRDLVKFFSEMLASFPSEHRLVLILDGIEHLLSDHTLFALSWIPASLPQNIKLILTFDHTEHKLLELLKSDILSHVPDSFLEVIPATNDKCEEFLLKILSSSGRRLTSDQTRVFRDVIEQEPSPIYVELLADLAKNLNSFTEVDGLCLPRNSEEAIESLLLRMEFKHGKVFVSRAFAYIIASWTGLSDCEMEDVLSLDDDVLNEVFQNFHPSIRRIPYIKWLSLKQDVEAFLTTRDVDCVTVTTWRHHSFHDVINKLYLSDDVTARLVHSNLADYFLGRWAGQSKPVTSLPGGRHSSSLYITDRKVVSQPHTFGDKDGRNVRYNKRMYEQVPRQLVLAGRHKELDNLVLFNYEWLYNKTKALSLQHVLADFALSPSEDAHLVEDALKMCETAIEEDIGTLPAQLSGHLLPYYISHGNIRSLIRQCDTEGLNHCALVPNIPYHQVPGGSLQFTLICPGEMEQFLLQDESRSLMCKRRDDSNVYTFDLASGELRNVVFTSSGELFSTPNGKYLVIVDHVTEKAIKIHDSATGAFIKQIIIMNYIEGKSSLYKKGPLCLTDDRLCAVVTLTNSALCICDIPSGEVLNIIFLDGRAQVCSLTPDGRQVFCNSNDFLLAYDVYNYQHLLTVQLGSKPSKLIFTHDGLRAFLCNNTEATVTTMYLNSGGVDMTYRTAFEEQMFGDCILNLVVSPDDSKLLIHGNRTLLVHDRNLDRIAAVLKKPEDIPEEFKLPRAHYVDLTFTQAEFTRDSQCVAAAIFRNVYIWNISSAALTSVIQGPIGVITSMLVSGQQDWVITHIDTSKDVQVWNIDESLKKIGAPDKLTDAVAEFQLTLDESLVFVKCRHSDELGVIDTHTGCMLDLLTHDSNVEDFAITPNGNWVLLSTNPKLRETAFKLWNMEERRLVLEAGNISGFCVGMNATNSVIMVTRRERFFQAPHFISVFEFMGSEFYEHTCIQTLPVVKSKPFVTFTDQYLIVNSIIDNLYPCIVIFDLEDGMQMSTWDARDMSFEEHLLDILDVRSCRQKNRNVIAVVFSCKNHHHVKMEKETIDIDNDISSAGYGFLLFDVSTRTPTLLCLPFLKPSYGLNDDHIVFSPDCSTCLDPLSNIFHIQSGEFVGQITSRFGPPRAFALWGSVVIYYSKTMLHVVRVSDSTVLANCDVRAPVSHLHVCQDERTILVGCQDGSVLSYSVIDPHRENETPVLGAIPSRKIGNPEIFEGRIKRAWDKVQQNGRLGYHRPPSSVTSVSIDRQLLKEIQWLPRGRPKSDTLVQLSNTSRSCCVM